MEKEDLYNSFDSIEPNDRQKSRMLYGILNQNENFTTVKKRKPKLVLAIAIICILSSTVIAVNIPAFQELLKKISPDIIEFIEPIEEVCINKGIKMEVVAAGRYDNMVKAYVTFQDLEGNRIGKDISFLDYYSLKGTNNSSWGSYSWSMIDYDEESKKATIFLEAEKDTKFEGESLTFKVDNIFYDYKEYEDHEIGVDLTKINHNPSHVNATEKQFMSWSYGKLYLEGKLIPILKPHERDIKFPGINTSMISNIGIIDGKLHVQIWRDKNFEGHDVDIYLKDSKGEKVFCDTSASFGTNKSGMPIGNADYPSYREYIFDIDTDRLDEYQLLGYFITCKQIEGPWQVTFKAEDGKTLEKTCNVNLGDVKIQEISINPFAISLRGKGINGTDLSNLDIKINTEEDVLRDTLSHICWNGTSWLSEGGKGFIATYDIEKPIDLSLIKSITINGINIPIE